MRTLTDALIDRVHLEHPATYAVLTLPSGERMSVASHAAAESGCPVGHSGFFADRIRPFCGPASIPGRGSSDLRPLVLDVHVVPWLRRVRRYRLDLRTNQLSVMTIG